MEQRDTQNQGQADNGQSNTTSGFNPYFERQNGMSFILKKTEKIITAVYMVTDIISESEPLRKELRSLSIDLLSKTRRVALRPNESERARIDDILILTEEIVGLLNLASTIGCISNMNCEILKKEFAKNTTELNHVYGEKNIAFSTHPGYSNILLNSGMFEVEKKVTIAPVENSLKGQENHPAENFVNNSVSYKNQTKPSNDFVQKKANLGIKIARRNDVLNIIKTKGQVSIKDISMLLKGMSEKTIQRELLSLTQEGVLKREGEKRWSTYRISS